MSECNATLTAEQEDEARDAMGGFYPSALTLHPWFDGLAFAYGVQHHGCIVAINLDPEVDV